MGVGVGVGVGGGGWVEGGWWVVGGGWLLVVGGWWLVVGGGVGGRGGAYAMAVATEVGTATAFGSSPMVLKTKSWISFWV